MPQLPYLPDAELAGMGGQLHSLTYSRIQRISTTEYIFSLKDWIDKLAQRAAVLSLHREKLYDATAYNHPDYIYPKIVQAERKGKGNLNKEEESNSETEAPINAPSSFRLRQSVVLSL